MFKKTMKFDDLEDNEVEQTFYFNYNKKEVMELLEFGQLSQFRTSDGRPPLEEQLSLLQTPTSVSGLTERENAQQSYVIFQDLILDAYGEKGADNVSFVKNEKTREYFRNHVAFVEMIFEFLENPKLAADFIENCLPAKYVAKAKAELAAKGVTTSADLSLAEIAETTTVEEVKAVRSTETPTEDKPKAIEELTEDDILNMPRAEFDALDPRKLSTDQIRVAFARKTQQS